jgi:MFS family permease
MSDRRLLYATGFLRALSTGMIGLVLAAYLARRGFPPDSIGLVVAAGLAGNAVALAVVSWLGPEIGAKRLLLVFAGLGFAGAAIAAAASSTAVLAMAAFGGILNGMGRDRGGALALEQALLPATSTDARRTQTFAWYNALQDAGHALGALLAGVPSLLAGSAGHPRGHRGLLWTYAAMALLSAAIYSPLRSRDGEGATPRLSRASRRIVARVSALFALDSLGGGFLTTALVSYFFFARFGASEGAVAVLFFVARVVNAASHFAAAALARRIGLVKTMVFTHMPSSVLLLTVAVASNFPVAAALFVLRESLVEMDVPTRQSYVMAIVEPHERTRVSGVTNLVRMVGWAIASLASGVVMRRVGLVVPLVVGAALKIAYDLLLYREFRHVRPPEELAGIHGA